MVHISGLEPIWQIFGTSLESLDNLLSNDDPVFEYRVSLTFAVGLWKYGTSSACSGDMCDREENVPASGFWNWIGQKYDESSRKMSQEHDAVGIFEQSHVLFEISNLAHYLWNNLTNIIPAEGKYYPLFFQIIPFL